MLIKGIIFILLGIYVIISDKYNLKSNESGREIVKNEDIKKDRFYKYKFVIGIFSVVLGVFSVLNYILY
ncbi:hypothetical protein FYJ27_04915 [Anaerosalibacter bizertensis]|uniref:Uncharacterized protein n=1 Tax=Anaerosalibacter bizertensis TaxID=932217 RepID=A0A844FGG6_9FIRM|nr:hypothetical protein [Anaerosalibacter bizertensis]MCB5559003.1 hypothetical protein [Anaerosalibacter bizertensis]MCG4584175.1 hypothetical protein [Anaerosalibacter bizertensis]MSS43074.1 hypothetical protein [Anaerosalibacter bizertensis]